MYPRLRTNVIEPVFHIYSDCIARSLIVCLILNHAFYLLLVGRFIMKEGTVVKLPIFNLLKSPILTLKSLLQMFIKHMIMCCEDYLINIEVFCKNIYYIR